jgi:calcineurin-like phosphoesterase family protein
MSDTKGKTEFHRTWFTSDHHFGHEKIIQYVDRPYACAAEMDDRLIEHWNDAVSPLDTVYHLGDFSLADIKYVFPLIFRLNGRIKLIPGGHDKWLSDYHKFQIDLGVKFEILPPLTEIKIQDVPFVLCHYPLLSWEASHYGSYHLHGHTHNTIGVLGISGDKQLPPKASGGRNGKRLDVGVDCHKYRPIEFLEIIHMFQEAADE